MNPKVEKYEKLIHELFEQEEIGFCADRFLNNYRHMYIDEDEYLKRLELRLHQGGMLI